MTEGRIKNLTEEQGIARIVETLKRAPAGDAPFALVLGAGFNQGLVPTTRELIGEALPLWIKALEEGETYESLKERIREDECAAIARSFWVKFVKDNDLDLELGPRGIPQDAAKAYKAAFDPEYAGALGAPADARAFQRALIRPNQRRLNAAHFLLASILGAQPGRKRPSEQLISRAALTRLILTTNFDPFLQTALQLVNRHYHIIDTPDLSLGDEIFDATSDAIHLVYVHGSIHRRSHKATPADIQRIKDQNARILAPVLEKHGIIVLGYSGWDDAIVDALAACPSFNHRLYWCGMRPDPAAKGAFGEKALEVLRKPSAFYVNIRSAEQFMARLSGLLVRGLPRLLDNPIAQAREMLESIDLATLGSLTVDASAGSAYRLAGAIANENLLLQAKDATIARLQEAEALFRTQPATGVDEGAGPSSRMIDGILASMGVASALGYYSEIQRCAEQALALTEVTGSQRRRVLFERALARFHLADLEGALEDWGAVAADVDAPAQEIANALNNRGVVWSETGERAKAIADYTRLIEALPGVTVDQIATALNNRGVAWHETGEREKAIGDYTHVIDVLADAPINQVADSLNHRGAAWAEAGEWDKAIADYTRVIDSANAPVDRIAKALFNRGLALGRKGEIDQAIADYTRVIEALPNAPVDQVAKALNARSAAWERQRNAEKAPVKVPEKIPEEAARASEASPISAPQPVEKAADKAVDNTIDKPSSVCDPKVESEEAIAHYARVIDALSDSPVDRVAKVLYNRTGSWGKKVEQESSLVEYARFFESLPDLDSGPVAIDTRSAAWQRAEAEQEIASPSPLIAVPSAAPAEPPLSVLDESNLQSSPSPSSAAQSSTKADLDRAIAEATRVIEAQPDVPVGVIANALNTRGASWGRKGERDKAIDDYTRVIEALPGAPIEQIAKALYNRAIMWGRKGNVDNAIADYTHVIEVLSDAPVEQVARALINRGVAWSQKGDLDNAIADYTFVIDALPGAPADQIANAYANRGWLHYEKQSFADFLADTQASLQVDPASDVASFNLGLALLATGRDMEAMEEYRRVGEKYRNRIQALALADLEVASEGWLGAERARRVMEMLRALMV